MRKTHNKNLFCIAIALFMLFAGTAFAIESGKININTATVNELVELKRIGPKYAEKIVEYRESYGPFKKAEDIMQVPGIGQKTWEMNKDRIVVDL
jgi:competence protein ComEA